MYIIKGYKTFKGHEGEPCAQGSLHGPKGKVAEWSDDSWGGPMRIDFTDAKEEAKFADWAKTYVPTVMDYDGKPYDPTTMSKYELVETAMAQLSYVYAQEKAEAAEAKKGIAYYQTSKDAGRGQALYTWKVPYTPENLATLRKEYPNAIIINEKMGMPFVDAKVHADAERNKRIKKLCAKFTIFSVRDATGATKDMQMKLPFSAVIAASLRSKHGANLVEIYNERFR